MAEEKTTTLVTSENLKRFKELQDEYNKAAFAEKGEAGEPQAASEGDIDVIFGAHSNVQA